MNIQKSRRKCCAVGCKNTENKNPDLHFYRIPRFPDKRAKWIKAIRRQMPDGNLCHPGQNARVCSAHFVGGKKSNNPADEAYIPTIFSEEARVQVKNSFLKNENLMDNGVSLEADPLACIKSEEMGVATCEENMNSRFCSSSNNERPESTMVTYGHNNAANVKNKSRADSCFVPMCPSTSTKFPNKLFLTGPSDPELRNKWFQAAKRDEHYSPKTIIRCCEDHFDLENDVENWIKFKIFGGKIFLKKDVVPHIFECQNRKLPMKPRLALMKRKRSEILEGTSAPLISETHGCQKPIISNEQGAKVTFTCGLCETTCKKYIGHPCLMNFKEVYVDKNGYFYPMMNDKKAYLRHGILGDGTEGIIVEQRNFSADKASTSSEVPSTTEKHQSNGFENWKISVSDEDVELLLKKVHERIPLWNYTIPIWERRWDIIQSLWKEVSAALDGRLNPDQCKVKFRSLRDTHRKIVNAELNGTDRSKPLWRFYHSCEFLRDHMLNSTHSHTPQMSDVDDDSQSDDDDDELIVEDHDYLAEIRSKPETNKYYQLPTLVRAPKR